jgi:hypothetical protein
MVGEPGLLLLIRLTNSLAPSGSGLEFDIDEINLELLLRLDTYKKRRTPSSGNDLR